MKLSSSTSTQYQLERTTKGRIAMETHKIGFRRCVALASALTLCMVFGTLHAQRVGAYVSGCDTDPVLKLSNGGVLVLRTQIDANPKDVTSIVYTVDLPVGVTVENIHSWGRLHKVETVVYSSQNTPGSYSADTVVTTASQGHAVTVSAELLSQDQTPLSSDSTSGWDLQDLNLHLTGDPSSD